MSVSVEASAKRQIEIARAREEQDVNNPLHGGSSAEYGQIPSSDSGSDLSSVELINRKSRNFLNNGVKVVKEEEATFREKVKTIDYSGIYAVTLLFIVGCFSGVFINVVLWAAAQLSHSQMKLMLSNDAGPFCLILTSAALSALAAFVCRKSGRVATIGSGIPEVKALLTNEFHPSELAMIVSSRIGFTRMFGMILSLGAGLSIGSAAPLVHMTVCNAYTIMKLSPDFGSLLENSSMMRQIFNASAAAGMAACFNCPLGGVLFSIEVTSSYYLLANYWRSFMAATAGAVLFTIILWWRGIDEARDYLQHPLLGPRLERATRAVLDSGAALEKLLGTIDAMKFASCMTLFAAAAGGQSVYAQALEGGLEVDSRTLDLLKEQESRNV